MRNHILFGIGAAACALLLSCRQAKDITGTWQLLGMEKGGSQQKSEGCFVRITQNGKNNYAVTGSTGVNRFMGSMRIEGNSVVPSEFASTKKAGPQEAMKFEQDFLALLNGAAFVSLSEGASGLELAIFDSGRGTKAVFAQRSLASTVWNVTFIEGFSGSTSRQQICFEEGEAIVHTGLNTMHLSYSADVSEGTLAFGGGSATLTSGAQEDMEAESALNNVIARTRKFVFSDSSLILQDENSNPLAELSPPEK